MKKILDKILIAGFIVVALFLTVSSLQFMNVSASVSVTDEYRATSTAPTSVYGAGISNIKTIKTGQGTFGSYVIMGSPLEVVNFYDATTTDINLRASNKSTSTILLASFPKNIAVGTYTFDVEFFDGLTVVVEDSGVIATGTITYR